MLRLSKRVTGKRRGGCRLCLLTTALSMLMSICHASAAEQFNVTYGVEAIAAQQEQCQPGYRTLNFVNNGSETIWVGAAPASLPNTGWEMGPSNNCQTDEDCSSLKSQPGLVASCDENTGKCAYTMCVPDNASAIRFWPRTGCIFGTVDFPLCENNTDCQNGHVCFNGVCAISCNGQTDQFCKDQLNDPTAVCYQQTACFPAQACLTGNCNNQVQCAGSGPQPPDNVIEFTLGGTAADNYDLSLLDGPNLAFGLMPIPNTYEATTGTCKQVGIPPKCTWDYSNCPAELRITLQTGAPCTSSSDCSSAEECLNGECVQLLGCLAPQKYCADHPDCLAGGSPCSENSDCCSQSCNSGNCDNGASLDCSKVFSMGRLTCNSDSECPPVSSNECTSDSDCPAPTKCIAMSDRTYNVCVEPCVAGVCVGIPCTSNSDCCFDGNCAPTAILFGQYLACDAAEPTSPTYQTCQPTAMSMYGCTGPNTSSCINAQIYQNATWCCGCGNWLPGKGKTCYSNNPDWVSQVEPIVQVFHDACPDGYSYPYDDQAGYPCQGKSGSEGAFGYTLIFSPRATIAADSTGVFRPESGDIYLKQENSSGYADTMFTFGAPYDLPITGDWNHDGIDTIGVYRNGVFYLRNSNSTGFADVVFAFGQQGDLPVAGDWDGDGYDTVGVYRDGAFYLRNHNSAGPADIVFYLGLPEDLPIAGNWDGLGGDTCGVFRPTNGLIFLKNENSSGYADVVITFGLPGDKPVTGDWEGNGTDTIGVYRNGVFYLKNSNTSGYADIQFALGIPGDVPIAGRWGLP